jgi:hypothetical protein
MADQDYVDRLAGQLTTRRPDLLDLAEDELAHLRVFKATVAHFLHNPAIALDIRQNLARDLHLPEPTR